MNERHKTTNISPDDIDLLLFIERILLFLKRYRWLFIIAIMLGAATGIFFYRSLPNVYRSRMVIHSFLLTNQEHIQFVANWNDLIKKKEYAELAATFYCNENIFPKIKKLKAEEIQRTFSGTNPHGFFIEVNVTDNAILDELQKSIVYAFENNEYTKERLSVRKANLEELIEKTTAEMQKLDSIKREIGNIIEGKGKSSSSLIVDGSSVNRQWIEMNEKLLAYKAELKFSNAVEVLQGFSKFKKPFNPKLIPWLVMGTGFFLVLAYLVALISSINEKIKLRSRLKSKA